MTDTHTGGRGLEELRIRGLGVIDEAVLPLGGGLTVVTGETGAGKTMVVTGLLLLFGGRADPARVRTGAEQASVEGRLLVPVDSPAIMRVEAAGGSWDPLSDGDTAELVLRRVVTAAGRSRAYVGGAGAPVAVLADLSDELLAVHGQSDQLRLVRPAAQREALDRYAGCDTSDYAAAHARWRAAEAAVTERVARAAELRREAGLLTHGLGEIDAAAPEAGESDELNRLAARLGHADALQAAARRAHDVLRGGDDPAPEVSDVLALLAEADRELAQQSGADAELDALASRVRELAALTADLGAEFGSYAAGLDTDPARLHEVESRRAVLAALVRKYGDDPDAGLDGVLRWAEQARERLAQIDVSDEAIAALRAEARTAEREVVALGTALSSRRRDAAERLGAAVTAELAGLAMAAATVRVEVRPRPPGSGPSVEIDGDRVGAATDGFDDVELLLQSHAGAPALPIAKGASGGELSRVMLALEVCLIESGTGHDGVTTLVFDEVDAGVGGRAAVEVGRRLARLARGRQVLVVTHLAQVAAFADRHVVVDKPAPAKRGAAGSSGDTGAVTASDVRVVEADERVAELARMLAGSDTATAREHASELLADAARDRDASRSRSSAGRSRRPTSTRTTRSTRSGADDAAAADETASKTAGRVAGTDTGNTTDRSGARDGATSRRPRSRSGPKAS
ncbi:DNA repair protein RecN [Jatrophihabitans fulvus]